MVPKTRHLMGALSLVVGMILTGCTAVPRATQLTVAPGVPRPVAAHLTNYQEAVHAIVSAMTEDLHIPVPRTSFTLYFYPYHEAFAQGLTEKFKTDPIHAQDIAKFALGRLRQTRESKQLLVNEEVLERQRWPERIHFLAHEITHIVQYELANGRPVGDQWLREGHADWVAFRVLEALGLDTFSARQKQQIARVRSAKERQALPSLSQLVTSDDWDRLSAKYGGKMVYGQAFLATAFLIQRRGLSSVLEYFRRPPPPGDRLLHFQVAFGDALSTFERDFSAYLEHLLQ
jgi:hypothetical protein